MIKTIRIFTPNKTGKEPPLPPVSVMVISLADTGKRVLIAVAKHQPVKAPKEVQDERWFICKACPKFRPSDNRCSMCGCHAAEWLVNKIEIAPASCPDKPPKWGPWKG